MSRFDGIREVYTTGWLGMSCSQSSLSISLDGNRLPMPLDPKSANAMRRMHHLQDVAVPPRLSDIRPNNWSFLSSAQTPIER